MPVIGRLENGELLVYEEVQGPDPYDPGARPTVEFGDLRQAVTRVVAMHGDDGRVPRQDDLADRTLTYAVHTRFPAQAVIAAPALAPVPAAGELTVSIPAPGLGITGGESVNVHAPLLDPGLGIVNAFGSGPDTVDVRLMNPTAAPVAPTPGQPLVFVLLGAGGPLAEEVAGVDLSTSAYTFLATGV